jgi:hypothetical protein
VLYGLRCERLHSNRACALWYSNTYENEWQGTWKVRHLLVRHLLVRHLLVRHLLGRKFTVFILDAIWCLSQSLAQLWCISLCELDIFLEWRTSVIRPMRKVKPRWRKLTTNSSEGRKQHLYHFPQFKQFFIPVFPNKLSLNKLSVYKTIDIVLFFKSMSKYEILAHFLPASCLTAQTKTIEGNWNWRPITLQWTFNLISPTH